MENTPDIKYLFEPRSVAVIGASHKPDKIGYKIVENILDSRYPGKVYPVNPNGGSILGLPVKKSILEIDDIVDIACIVVPAKNVFSAVTECAEKKVKFLVIISSGFSEIGNIEEERKIVKYALEHNMRVLGPNIFGIYSSAAPINATFGPRDILPGSIGIVTQSGALGIAMMGKTKEENIGVSAIVSVGNKSDIDETDLLEYLISDKQTKVILMYIEGIKNGERFVKVLKQATKKKPVVIIKSGRSKKGAIAAASHTGSLAGADEVFSDIAYQCGALRAETLSEALEWCKFLAFAPEPKGERAVIITNGGGIGVMAADACEKYGISLYDDTQKLHQWFSKFVPEFGSTRNPVDLTGQASDMDYQEILEVALKNEEIHSIICIGCETAVFDMDSFAKRLEGLINTHVAKPFVFAFFGGAKTEGMIQRLRAQEIPAFSEVYTAVSCLGVLYQHYRNKYYSGEESQEEIKIDIDLIQEVINNARKEGRRTLLYGELEQLAKAAGISLPKSGVARSIEEALALARQMQYPVVLKVVSRDILHKSDVGGVALNIENDKELIDAYQAIIFSCKQHRPDARIEGIQVSEMVKPGVEVIVGARRDKIFGPICMFGLGGIYVEVLKDVVFRALPLSRKEVTDMIRKIKAYPVLMGVRGEERKDVESIVDTIMRLSALVKATSEISEIEINPLVVYEHGSGAKAIDMRVILSSGGKE